MAIHFSSRGAYKLKEEELHPYYGVMKKAVVRITFEYPEKKIDNIILKDGNHMNEEERSNLFRKKLKKASKDSDDPLEDDQEFSDGENDDTEKYDECVWKFGFGTGTVIDRDGGVLTCAHVCLDGLRNLRVIYSDSSVHYQATIIHKDDLKDLAYLRPIQDVGRRPYASLYDLLDTTTSLHPFAIGRKLYTIAHGGDLRYSFFSSRISQVRSYGDLRDPDSTMEKNAAMLQMHGSNIASGSSGGPLFDHHGRVLGVWLFSFMGSDFAVSIVTIEKFLKTCVSKVIEGKEYIPNPNIKGSVAIEETNTSPVDIKPTLLHLIPKTTSPTNVSQYRSIACGETNYKFISMLAANRLQPLVDIIMSSNQSAFVAGRAIQDNLMLAYEITRIYDCKHISHRSPVKIDPRPAFDSVNLEIVDIAISTLNIPLRYTRWVSTCVSDAAYYMISGTAEGFVNGKRGLLQGNPSVPYIFVIIVELLLVVVRRADQVKQIQFHPKCGRIGLYYLTFADDLLFFFKGNQELLKSLFDLLKSFSDMTRLHESSLVCGEFSDIDAKATADNQGAPLVNLPLKYLGLPLLFGRFCIRECQPIIEKIKDSVMDWKINLSAHAGQVLLIISILCTALEFRTKIFFLAVAIHEKVNSICQRLLYAGSKMLKCMHYTANRPTLRKSISEGGLGLPGTERWNVPVLCGPVFKLLTCNESLENNLKGKSFRFCKIPKVTSWTRRNILMGDFGTLEAVAMGGIKKTKGVLVEEMIFVWIKENNKILRGNLNIVDRYYSGDKMTIDRTIVHMVLFYKCPSTELVATGAVAFFFNKF